MCSLCIVYGVLCMLCGVYMLCVVCGMCSIYGMCNVWKVCDVLIDNSHANS